jgi:hypothetical protein
VGALQLEEQNSKHINHNKHENKEKNGEPKQKEKCNWKGKKGSTTVLGSILRAYGATTHGVQLKTYITYLSQLRRKTYINA